MDYSKILNLVDLLDANGSDKANEYIEKIDSFDGSNQEMEELIKEVEQFLK